MTETWVDHPYRDGLVLIGDAAGASDPTSGQGLSLTSRDVRVLAEKLLSANDWDAAAHSYAEDHDRYFNVTREVGQWLFDIFLARGPEHDRLRERALPHLMTEPDRITNHIMERPRDALRRRCPQALLWRNLIACLVVPTSHLGYRVGKLKRVGPIRHVAQRTLCETSFIGSKEHVLVMRVLLVEDDAKIADFVVKGLTQAGFAVDHSTDGEDGLNLALTESYDTVVLDLMLPTLDGLELLRRLRQRRINTPVIILSAMRSVDDRVKGLHTGGDDYLTKPFVFAELLARVQALIRRDNRAVEPTHLSVANISVDLLTRQVVRGEQQIDLQAREFALLEYFLRNPGRVISKTMILEHIWNYHFDPQTNVVDVLVCRLRNKLDPGRGEKLIRTIRGVGYVFKAS